MQQDRTTVIDVKFAIQVISAVSSGLRSEIVTNCFRKAGFGHGDIIENTGEEFPQNEEVLSILQKTTEAPETFQEFVTAHMDVVCFKELTDEAIFAQVNGICMGDEQDKDEDIVVRKLSAAEAEHASKLFRATRGAEK